MPYYFIFRSTPVPAYYVGSWSNLDFICAMESEPGMLHCSDIEPTVSNGLLCTEDFFSEDLDPAYRVQHNDTCVNYNQYYTECRRDGPNPFLESISFDNIAHAWIAIFQVRFTTRSLYEMLKIVYCAA